MSVTPKQTIVATRVWFEAARVEWLRTYPDKDCPIPAWDEINPDGRSFFTRVMARALKASAPDSVERIFQRMLDSDEE